MHVYIYIYIYYIYIYIYAIMKTMCPPGYHRNGLGQPVSEASRTFSIKSF